MIRYLEERKEAVWTARTKFAAVLETAALSEAEKSTGCRQRGIYLEVPQRWRCTAPTAHP